MIEQSVHLASNGSVQVSGYEQLARFGYTKNRGVYRLSVTATGEWEGLTIRAFWHTSDGKDPASSLVADGYVDVPASVTARAGNGCITFEGSDGTKTVTSADLRYRVSANSGTEDGTEPEPGTPAWQQLVDAVHTDATAAEQAKNDAQTAANEAATSAGNADQSAQEAADSLQELKDGIASGDFKGEPGTSPTVTVQDIAGGHRIVITDATGTSSVDVMDGKQGDPGKPGDTGATPELTIGTVEEGDAPSATITGTAKNPVLNLTLKSGAPGKDAAVDATLSQSGKAADAKVTGDELARKAVIDDTAVGTDAWSSKHIVDVLCPPLEETGNPVQCYPVTGYPLGCKVSWEPTQEGTGDPSPENIRPIKGRDGVTVERCGANLLKFNDQIDNETRAILENDELVFLSKCFRGKNVMLTFACDTKNIVFGDTEESWRKRIGFECHGFTVDGAEVWALQCWMNEGEDSLPRDGKHIKSVLTTMPDIAKGAISFYAQNIESGTFTAYDFGIYEGKTLPDNPAPYDGVSIHLSLPTTIYGGTVDAVTGEGQETWKLVTLDGTEKWHSWGINANNHAVTGFYTYDINDYDAINVKAICSHVKASSQDVWGGQNAGIGFATVGDSRYFMYCVPTSLLPDISAGHETASLKSYLAAQYEAGTPVQIAYKLATPIHITATGAQPIPALSGVNTVLTDADSVTVTGRADPIKRITDLEDAVASMT